MCIDIKFYVFIMLIYVKDASAPATRPTNNSRFHCSANFGNNVSVI